MEVNVKNVSNFIHRIKDKWHSIGIELEVDQVKLNTIRRNYKRDNDADESLIELISEWLKSQQKWQTLIDALRSNTVNEPVLARQGMAINFCQCMSQAWGYAR